MKGFDNLFYVHNHGAAKDLKLETKALTKRWKENVLDVLPVSARITVDLAFKALLSPNLGLSCTGALLQ